MSDKQETIMQIGMQRLGIPLQYKDANAIQVLKMETIKLILTAIIPINKICGDKEVIEVLRTIADMIELDSKAKDEK